MASQEGSGSNGSSNNENYGSSAPNSEPKAVFHLQAKLFTDGQISVTGFPNDPNAFFQLMADINRAVVKHYMQQCREGKDAGSQIMIAHPKIFTGQMGRE